MIEVSHITKRYGGFTAVSDLGFTIEKGGIYGLLGANGAGKTTTMNIMTGCMAASEGDVRIDGYDIFEDARKAKKLIGYLPEQPPVYMDMTPEEYLRFVGGAKGLKGETLVRQTERVIEIAGVGEMRGRLIRNLSKGYRQRVGIAQALMGEPEIIVLDEPTVGLDPKQIIEIRGLIAELGREHTVILSSHILSEVRAVCGHIMIISHGRLVANDSPENLETLFAGDSTLTVTARADADTVRRLLENIPGARLKSLESGETAATAVLEATDTEAAAEAAFFAFAAEKKPILSMTPARASLEDVFLELTEDRADAAVADNGEGGASADHEGGAIE